MLSFDLRTATFSYSPGYVASITYTPEVDSYEVSFSCDEEGKANPHDFLAALSSHRLNELAADRGTGRSRGTVGVKFIGVRSPQSVSPIELRAEQLLRNTLPVLLEVGAIRAAATSDFPKLVVRSVSQYRLVWDVQSKHRSVLPCDHYRPKLNSSQIRSRLGCSTVRPIFAL